jgi:hypothetical protein
MGVTDWTIPLPAAALLLAAASAAAASCGPPAVGGLRIQGVVREAASGAVLCVQTRPDSVDLTRVRLSDVVAPRLQGPGGEGAKWALRRLARGRRVDCRMDGRGSGAGVCTIDGAPIGALLARRTPATRPASSPRGG